jgi:hypothetical protein
LALPLFSDFIAMSPFKRISRQQGIEALLMIILVVLIILFLFVIL